MRNQRLPTLLLLAVSAAAVLMCSCPLQAQAQVIGDHTLAAEKAEPGSTALQAQAQVLRGRTLAADGAVGTPAFTLTSSTPWLLPQSVALPYEGGCGCVRGDQSTLHCVWTQYMFSGGLTCPQQSRKPAQPTRGPVGASVHTKDGGSYFLH